MNVKPVKTAIVGCGGISDIFFKNFTERFEIIDLVKCCSRGKASADKKAQQYGIESSTLDEILADHEIELIANLTPPLEHYATIKAALEAGKHVWTEKTITTDIEQSFRTRSFYRMTTSVERPAPLPKGSRGIPGFFFPEESSLL